MEEIYELVENKRIFVRKKIANFLEKLFRHCGYDFDHDVFKKIIYSEEEYKTPIEEKLNTRMTPISIYYIMIKVEYRKAFGNGCITCIRRKR